MFAGMDVGTVNRNTTYYSKPVEDLVHAEVLFPENPPKEFATTIISLPNDWSYELAVELMRDYLKRNFVDEGMCIDFAIHDSENKKHQRNLHCYVMLTLRPFDENWEHRSYKEQGLDILGE